MKDAQENRRETDTNTHNFIFYYKNSILVNNIFQAVELSTLYARSN